MMYRDDTKLFHVAWQCVPFNTSGLQWCHAVSEDFVSWKTLPPMINRSGAESGGVAQLPNGDIVAIFNEVGGGGHWQARPTNLSDPFLTFWEDTHPNGTGCSGRCAATPGIPGTDLSQAFLDGSGDGKWRVIADRPDAGGAKGAAMIAATVDFTNFTTESTFHEYKWTRCITLPELCGFGPYPRDPNAFSLPLSSSSAKRVWVFYGMQKTCSFSGREFYALGTYDAVTRSFTVLNKYSDYANNVWDGGEGYASMHVYDPVGKRMLWLPAVIEGDRDPCHGKDGSGFWQSWMANRSIGAGWFGTLGLPREVHLLNLSKHFEQKDGNHDSAVFLRTPPLPELSKLRTTGAEITTSFEVSPGSVWTDRRNKIPRAQTVEVDLTVKLLPAAHSWDFGAQVLWSDDSEEYVKVGVQDADVLPGVDLWDEVNGDSKSFNATSLEHCRTLCMNDVDCEAWTFTALLDLCRFKAHARFALQTANSNGAFQPFHDGSTSGYKQPKSGVRYASVYINRDKHHFHRSSNAQGLKDIPLYPNFGYAKALIIEPGQTELNLHVFVDKTIIEVFAQNGSSVVTCRAYPTLKNSNNVGVYNDGSSSITVARLGVWKLGSAKNDHLRREVMREPDSPPDANKFIDPRDPFLMEFFV